MSHKYSFALKFLSTAILSLTFLAAFMAIMPYRNIKASPAYSPDPPPADLPGCSTADGYNCPDNLYCSCPEWDFDWCGNQDKGSCTCITKPDNQQDCEHTICPVGYRCIPNNPDRSCKASYCVDDGGNPPPQVPQPPPGNPPAPTPVASAMCADILAYSTTWVPYTTATLATLTSNNQVYFCARGSTNLGAFTKAKFTINGTPRAETVTQRPGTTNEFCDLYTIPTNTYNFNVVAQIYHLTLGWTQ